MTDSKPLNEVGFDSCLKLHLEGYLKLRYLEHVRLLLTFSAGPRPKSGPWCLPFSFSSSAPPWGARPWRFWGPAVQGAARDGKTDLLCSVANLQHNCDPP